MKMLLLDVEHREVKLVEANGLNDYYNFIACDYVDIRAYYLKPVDIVAHHAGR